MQDTPTSLSPRQIMSAAEFVKIWKGEYRDNEKFISFYREGMKMFNQFFETVNDTGDLFVVFSDVKIEGEIRLEDKNDPLPNLILTNVEIDRFSLKGYVVKDLIIEKSTVNTIYIADSEMRDLILRENSEHGEIWIKKSVIVGEVFIEKSEVSVFDIKNSVLSIFSIKNAKIWDISIDNVKIEHFIVQLKSWIRKFKFKYSEIKLFEVLQGTKINELAFFFSSQSQFHVILRNCVIATIDFSNQVIPEFSIIEISDCRIYKLIFESFSNFGSVFLSNIKAISNEDLNDNSIFSGEVRISLNLWPSTFHLTNSDLGKMQFINCNLNEFQRFKFFNTKMLDIFVAGSQMPEAAKFQIPEGVCPPERTEEKAAEQKRLAYGQFKKIYEARGDTAGSLRYLAFEMEAYREQLGLEKVRPRFSKKWWRSKEAWDNRVERAILTLNKLSTNYGNNWHRGFWMTVLMIFVCFSIYISTLCYDFLPTKEGFKFLGKLFSFAPQYLNPFRDADSIIPEKFLPSHLEVDTDGKKILPWSTRLVDYFGRVVVAYFVYQTIQAFRKLGRSSG